MLVMSEKEKKSNFGFDSGLVMPLQKGPFQNNGASPWFANIGVGTPSQKMKFSFDTGSNFNWVTSTFCKEPYCQHFGGGKFDAYESITYLSISEVDQKVDFGPWGEMLVVAGNDDLQLLPKTRVNSDLYLSRLYKGEQFKELDWDGGIGLPTLMHAPLAENEPCVQYRGVHCKSREASFHFVETLVEQGLISQECPYVSFSTDSDTGEGEVTFGILDVSYADSLEYLFLPWQRYSIESLYYIWTTPLTKLSLNGEEICQSTPELPQWFCLDSGSSQFKGDPINMKVARALAKMTKGNFTITIPDNELTHGGNLIVPESLYDVYIEEGLGKGERVVQFEPMDGLDALTLVGSVIMDSLYCVYQYRVEQDNKLQPVGMWIFNKRNGLKIIDVQQSKPAPIFAPRYHSDSQFVGRWVNSYGSQMDLVTNEKGELFGSYSSTTGASGRYLVYGFGCKRAEKEKGMPLVLSISWHPYDQMEENASWHWVSTYCGQLTERNNKEMSVVNSLVATCSFEGAETGDYLDLLSFEKVTDYISLEQQQDLEQFFASTSSVHENKINGDWISELSDVSVSIYLKDPETGLSFASFRQDGKTAEMKGFVDVFDSKNITSDRQSITLSGCLEGVPVSISGYRDRIKDKLVLSYWRALAQPESESYMQANAQSLICSRMK
ncbi:TPA: hypothetical protein I7122_09520 [Vibrio vulnificus]|nr:hypothetical protein [Vibrio vulnificus]HAS8440777.1 A1 family peptidase [Vibrio vulnificus]